MSTRSFESVVSAIPPACRWKLDQEIDSLGETNRAGPTVPRHLGKIADSMLGWDGGIADGLGLTEPERANIRYNNTSHLNLQKREALNLWKSKLGKAATYRALIKIFIGAGKADYADRVCDLLKEEDSKGDSGFSPALGTVGLARWLRQEFEADYKEDVDKIVGAKINGKQLLSMFPTLVDQLKLSLGFQWAIKNNVKELKEPDNTPSGGASLSSGNGRSTGQASTVDSHQDTPGRLSRDSHETLYSQLRVHASKWSEMGTFLGFSQAELSNIRARPALFNDAPISHLRAMLSDWLEWTCDPASPTHKPATLERLKYAVSQAGLGRTATELHL